MSTKSDDLAVFTHSVFHRTASFLIVGIALFCYLKQFFYVSSFYREFAASAGQDQSTAFLTAIKLSLILGLVAGFLVVCLFIYTLIDVWGLKVMVTGCSVIVMNTLMPFPGTGEMPCVEIIEIRKGLFRFHLVGEKGVLRFSGVEGMDRLFYLISECKRMNKKRMSKTGTPGDLPRDPS